MNASRMWVGVCVAVAGLSLVSTASEEAIPSRLSEC